MVGGFNSNSLSEKNKEALKSETWNQARKAVEVKHFTADKNTTDSEYGATCHEIVFAFLETGYKDDQNQHEVEVFGQKYKVLKREKVTIFYDEAGSTLFDVENERLEREYEWLMNAPMEPKTSIGKTIADIEKQAFENAVDIEKTTGECEVMESNVIPMRSDPQITQEDFEQIQDQAKKKLEDEMKKAKEKSFAEPIIGYLLKRCEDNKSLAEDVMQEQKTWDKCFNYIYSKAREQSKGNCAAIRDEVVYEWAEDYYQKDDKAEEEIKVKENEERKKQAAEKAKKDKEEQKKRLERQKKHADKMAVGKEEHKKEIKSNALQKESADRNQPVEIPKTTKRNKDMDGQLDLFSMMGMGGE